MKQVYFKAVLIFLLLFSINVQGQDTLPPVLSSPTIVDSALSVSKDTFNQPKPIDTNALKKMAIVKRHSAKKAAWLSAALPGLGQAYNHKYWKIPIIYAGFGGLGYALYYNTSNFVGYRDAYRVQTGFSTSKDSTFHGVSNPATLKDYRDYYKRYLDVSAIATIVWYGLNLVDAAVDGHLFEYNVNDNLTMRWQPDVHLNLAEGGAPYFGVHFSLRM